jgi:hypothetical protein
MDEHDRPFADPNGYQPKYAAHTNAKTHLTSPKCSNLIPGSLGDCNITSFMIHSRDLGILPRMHRAARGRYRILSRISAIS